MANTGIRTKSIIKTEWAGPRCSMNGINMSMSGMTESVRITGILIPVFVNLVEALLKIYPNAKCPTAYDLLASDFCKSKRSII